MGDETLAVSKERVERKVGAAGFQLAGYSITLNWGARFACRQAQRRQAGAAEAGRRSSAALDIPLALIFSELPGPCEPVGDRLAVDDQLVV